MKLDFRELLSTLNKEFGQKVGMNINYVRSDVSNSKIEILMQYYLDPLCVSEFEFVVVDDGIKIKSFKYDDVTGDGKYKHPYKVSLKDNTKPMSIKNIDGVTLNLW